MARRIEIEDTITRRYIRLNAKETQLVVRLLPPSDARYPVSHLLASVKDLFRHTLHNLSDSDMVVITIQNLVNQNDKPIWISFRIKDQLAGGVIISLVEKVSQSNSRFEALEKLIMTYILLGCVWVSAVELRARADRSQSWHNLKQVSWRSRQQKIVCPMQY